MKHIQDMSVSEIMDTTLKIIENSTRPVTGDNIKYQTLLTEYEENMSVAELDLISRDETYQRVLSSIDEAFENLETEGKVRVRIIDREKYYTLSGDSADKSDIALRNAAEYAPYRTYIESVYELILNNGNQKALSIADLLNARFPLLSDENPYSAQSIVRHSIENLTKNNMIAVSAEGNLEALSATQREQLINEKLYAKAVDQYNEFKKASAYSDMMEFIKDTNRCTASDVLSRFSDEFSFYMLNNLFLWGMVQNDGNGILSIAKKAKPEKTIVTAVYHNEVKPEICAAVLEGVKSQEMTTAEELWTDEKITFRFDTGGYERLNTIETALVVLEYEGRIINTVTDDISYFSYTFKDQDRADELFSKKNVLSRRLDQLEVELEKSKSSILPLIEAVESEIFDPAGLDLALDAEIEKEKTIRSELEALSPIKIIERSRLKKTLEKQTFSVAQARSALDDALREFESFKSFWCLSNVL